MIKKLMIATLTTLAAFCLIVPAATALELGTGAYHYNEGGSTAGIEKFQGPTRGLQLGGSAFNNTDVGGYATSICNGCGVPGPMNSETGGKFKNAYGFKVEKPGIKAWGGSTFKGFTKHRADP